MMRVPKFRGKVIKSDVWAYGILEINKSTVSIKQGFESWIVDPETIGQMIEIGGEEYYEGDNIGIDVFARDVLGERYYNRKSAIIEYDEDSHCFIAKWDDGKQQLTNESRIVEVIGNIHDKTDLESQILSLEKKFSHTLDNFSCKSGESEITEKKYLVIQYGHDRWEVENMDWYTESALLNALEGGDFGKNPDFLPELDVCEPHAYHIIDANFIVTPRQVTVKTKWEI